MMTGSYPFALILHRLISLRNGSELEAESLTNIILRERLEELGVVEELLEVPPVAELEDINPPRLAISIRCLLPHRRCSLSTRQNRAYSTRW